MLKPRYFAEDALSVFDKKIMIVRDPRDRLISAFLFKGLSRPKHAADHIEEFIKLLEEKERNPSALPFLELNDRLDEIQLGSLNIETVLNELEYQLECIEAHGFHICYYEDFVAEKFAALQSYLGFELISQNPSQTAWLKHIERSKDSGEWRQWLTSEDIEHLKPKLGPVMERMGYDEDWSLPAIPSIDPQQSSEHVRRNFESRRQQMESASNRGDLAETPEELELIELRADDGRVDDILRAGRSHESGTSWMKPDIERAFYWYELGMMLGNKSAFDSARGLVRNGFRPTKLRSLPAQRWVENQES